MRRCPPFDMRAGAARPASQISPSSDGQRSRRILVLTRKPGQSIMIGDDVEVTVLSCGGGAVRLGIRAPSRISVHRTEIFLAIASQDGSDDGGKHELPSVAAAS